MSTSILNVEQAFYTGDFPSVLDAQVDNSERVRALQVRALIATNRTSEALEILSGDESTLAEALRLYAEHKTDGADALLAKDLDSAARHILGLALAQAGEYDRALAAVAACTDSLDAVYLRVHVHLLRNNVKAAQGEIDAARPWANDHIIFNVAEALVCLRNNAAQKAYFIYEENNSLKPTPTSSLGETVAQILLHRFPEAEQALPRALESEDEAARIAALALQLTLGQSSEAEETRTELQKKQYTNSAAVADIKEKERLFDEAVLKFGN